MFMMMANKGFSQVYGLWAEDFGGPEEQAKDAGYANAPSLGQVANLQQGSG